MWEFVTYSMYSIMGGLGLIGLFFAIRSRLIKKEDKDLSWMDFTSQLEKEDVDNESNLSAMILATTKLARMNQELSEETMTMCR